MIRKNTNLAVKELETLIPEEQIVIGEKTEKYSKDFYWYSPVLKEALEEKKADAAILVKSKEELRDVVSTLYKNDVPFTIKGGASGNYGQMIPIYGGAVIDVTGMDKIFSLDGVVHAEGGASVRKIEIAARELGWEMRMLPTTWAISSFAGFLCGGSGGVGSITYGGIASDDNVKSVTIMTVEEEPQFMKFEGEDVHLALHAWGTTGIVVEAEMRLGKAVDWEQLIFNCEDWDTLLDWTYGVACDSSVKKRLVSQFETPFPEFFKPLTKHIPTDKHCSFLMVDPESVEKVVAAAAELGIEKVYQKPWGTPPKPPFITDFTWNHATLWAMKAEPAFTYLQCGFGDEFKANYHKLKAKFGDDFLIHFEMTTTGFESGEIRVGSIPVVRYSSKERLDEMIAYCESIGVSVSNPHTFSIEEGGHHTDLSDKCELKSKVDPKGLLNPGKMKTYEHNPFELAEA